MSADTCGVNDRERLIPGRDRQGAVLVGVSGSLLRAASRVNEK